MILYSMFSNHVFKNGSGMDVVIIEIAYHIILGFISED